MKLRGTTLFLLISIFISSCGVDTPETIVGIKLGLNPQAQISAAKSAGTLKSDGRDNYIEVSQDIKGYPRFFSMDDEKGNEILHTIWLYFSDNGNSNADPTVTKKTKDRIIDLYEKKYGVCRPWKNGDEVEGDQLKDGQEHSGEYNTYMWKKGHLVIHLSFSETDTLHHLMMAVTRYEYDFNYKEGLDKKVEKKKNGGI